MKIEFKTYTTKMMEVYGDAAIPAILWTVASIFQDIVVKENGSFPIMFLRGPNGSGKSSLMNCCQSFFGLPQPEICLQNSGSIYKNLARSVSQSKNGMVHLNEYSPGNTKLDAIVKALWDRRLFDQINSKDLTIKIIPVTSCIGITGSEYPDNEQLSKRLIIVEMERPHFIPAHAKSFQELRDMTLSGVSGLTDEILVYHNRYKKQFKKIYTEHAQFIKLHAFPRPSPRIASNTAVLLATYDLLRFDLDFPFGQRRARTILEWIMLSQTLRR